MMLIKFVLANGGLKPMRKGKGRFFNSPSVSKGKKYDKFFVYIPTEVARDSNCPFKHGDRVEVEIKGKVLIIQKAEEK